MTATPSTMLALGTPLPAFRLPDLDGRLVSPDDVRDAPALLIAFICHHCPFVRHIRHEFARVDTRLPGARSRGHRDQLERRRANFRKTDPTACGRKRATRAIRSRISSTRVRTWRRLFARRARLICFCSMRPATLVYRGQFDGSRPRNTVPVTGQDLRAACDARARRTSRAGRRRRRASAATSSGSTATSRTTARRP